MPKSKPIEPVSVGSARLDRKSRLSLPEKEFRHEKDIQRRNTISEYTNKGRKKVKAPLTPTIIEDEDDVSESQIRYPAAVVENEIQKASKVDRKSSNASRHSVASKSSKSTYVYDNFAYEGSGNRPGSTGNSIKNISKAPSVQSLEIYHEQYCCFTRRTKCERSLLITVIVLCIIIVVLIIVIGVLAKHIHDPSGFQLFSTWH